MRVLALVFFSLSIYSSCKNSSAHVNLQDEKEVRKALSNTWQAVYMETAGSRVKVPETQKNQITYEANGKYSSKVKDGTIETRGEWRYDPHTRMVRIGVREDTGLGRIIQLSGNELLLVQYTTMNDIIVDSIITTFKKN